MKTLDTPLIRVLKYLTAVLLAAVVVVVGVNFFFHTQNRTQVEARQDDIELNRVEGKEKIRHTEEERGRPVLEFEAERHYLGKDGYYHLEGSVKVAFPQPGEDEDILFQGDEIIHGEELEWFQVNGKARIKSGDMIIDSVSLQYDSQEGVVTGEQGFVFRSDRFKGTAQQAIWKVKRDEMILRHEVRLEMEPHAEDAPPVIVQCGEMEYLRKWGHGFLRDGVQVAIGKNHIYADSFEFRMTEDRTFLRSVKVQGNAEAHLAGQNEEKKSQPEASYAALDGLLQSGDKRFVSEEMFLVFFHDMVKIQEFRSNRECEVYSAGDSGDSLQLRAGELRFRLNPEGGLKEFLARGNVRLEEHKSDAESFEIEAGILRIKKRKHVLEILKGKQETAKVIASGFKIWGGSMDYFLNNRNLEVKEGVDVILNADAASNPGFFSSSEPLFIKSEKMRYIQSNQRFFFTGATKFWQKAEMLEARSLVLDKENGKVMAADGVRSVFPYQPDNEDEEKRIEITSLKMDYRPYQNEIFFEGDCSFQLQQAVLTAGEITLLFSEEERTVRGLIADKNVTVKQGDYSAHGMQAFFSAAQNEIVLAGKAVLIDKIRGRTEGDKLTFSLSDDRIIVENQGRERSLTVIK